LVAAARLSVTKAERAMSLENMLLLEGVLERDQRTIVELDGEPRVQIVLLLYC